MLKVAAAALLFAGLAVAGCDNPKPRRIPDDPMAVAPTPLATPQPGEGMSGGLPKRPELPGFYVDRVGAASDPFNRQPAVAAGDRPMVIDGFGFDPVAKAPAKGVDVVIDGKAYGAAYGHARPDVADYNKTPALVNTGYALTLPAGTLAAGLHSVSVRVIAADGGGYFESPSIGFQVK